MLKSSKTNNIIQSTFKNHPEKKCQTRPTCMPKSSQKKHDIAHLPTVVGGVGGFAHRHRGNLKLAIASAPQPPYLPPRTHTNSSFHDTHLPATWRCVCLLSHYQLQHQLPRARREHLRRLHQEGVPSLGASETTATLSSSSSQSIVVAVVIDAVVVVRFLPFLPMFCIASIAW